jgi:hypothetical protein
MTKRDPWMLFRPISDAESCRKVLKEVSVSFYVLAAIQAIVGALVMPGMIVDGILLAVLAVLVQTIKSRVAAILLLLLTSVMLVTTGMTVLGIAEMGGKNVWLALIAAWCGIKAVEATFKYHSKYKTSEVRGGLSRG